MADQLSFEELLVFGSLSNIINRTAAVYYSSDLIGLEICERRLEEHTRVLAGGGAPPHMAYAGTYRWAGNGF